MSGERPTLAEAMCPRRSSPCGSCRSAEPGARQWFLDLLADDTLLRDAHIAVAPHASQPYAAARAVLAVIAEAVRDER